MRHPGLVQWEHRIKAMFDEIDDELEDKYGGTCPLHPSRPERGSTSNREADGLFNVGADFSAGYGSSLGRGYTVRVRMATLEHVPPALRAEIESDVEHMVRIRLPSAFPRRSLSLERDGSLLRITGDFHLGPVNID